MKTPQFYITAGLGFLCLLLSVTNIVLSQSNTSLQFQANEAQEQVNSNNSANQILQNIVRDLANNASGNDKIRTLLENNGFTIAQAQQSSGDAE